MWLDCCVLTEKAHVTIGQESANDNCSLYSLGGSTCHSIGDFLNPGGKQISCLAASLRSVMFHLMLV